MIDFIQTIILVILAFGLMNMNKDMKIIKGAMSLFKNKDQK